MATIYTRATKGSALTWTEGDANITNLNNDKIEDIVEDTTPQLGGNLDVNGNSIVSASNGNIAITPNGTGSIVLDGQSWPQSDGTNGQVLTTNGSGQLSFSTVSGGITDVVNDTTPQLGGNLDVNGQSIVSTSNGDIVINPNGTGVIVLDGLDWPALPAGPSGFTGTVTSVNGTNERISVTNAVNISLGDQITFTGADAVDAGITTGVTYYVITANDIDGYIQISDTSGGSAKDLTTLSMPGDFNWSTGGGAGSFAGGEVLTYSNTAGGLVWVAPSGGGGSIALNDLTDVNTSGVTNGQVLYYDGGTSQWSTITLSSGGLENIVEDTTPQLGGNLDVNGQQIVSASNGNITIAPNGTGKIVAKNLQYNEFVYNIGTTSGTISPDVANGNIQNITLDGNITFSGFSNPVAGQKLTLIINTNGTGRTLTSTMKFSGGNKTLSIINTTDIINVFYDGTNYWATLVNDFNFKLLWNSWNGANDGSILSFAFGGSRNAGRITDTLSLMVGRQSSSESFARVLSLSGKSLSVSTATAVSHISGYATPLAIVRIDDTSAFVIEDGSKVYKIFNITSSGCSVSSNTVSITNSGTLRGGRVDATGKLILWNTRSGHAGRVTLDITGTTTITKNSETNLSYSSASTGIIQSLCILNDTEALAICGVSGAVKGFKLSSTATQIGTTYTSTLTNPTVNGQVTFQNLDKGYSIIFFMEGTSHRYFLLKEASFTNFLITPASAFSGQLTVMDYPHVVAGDETAALFSMINSSNIICHWSINIETSSVIYFNNTGNGNTDPYQNPLVKLNDTKIFANLSDGNRYKILSLD